MKISRRIPVPDEYSFFQRTIAAQLHLLGFFLVLLGAIFLLPKAYHAGAAEFYASISFILGGLLVFLTSAIYHFMYEGFTLSQRLYLFLENLDHFSIYLFIAGSYSPVLVDAVSEPWKTILLVGIWSIALLGILYTAFKPRLPKVLQHRMVYTGVFVIMGWTLLLRLNEVFHNLSFKSCFFLIAGGAAYTLGAVVYALKKPKLIENLFGFHELWHLMVLFGAISHYFMVYFLYS